MLVVDASVAAKWFIDEPNARYADTVLDLVQRGGAIVPAVFVWEVQNSLIKAERSRRLTAHEVDEALDALTMLPISIDPMERSFRPGNELSLARGHNLSSYDAAYLTVALTHRLMLATEDKRLATAAADMGMLFELP